MHKITLPQSRIDVVDSNPEPVNNWYVLYTAPRAEKVVRYELEVRGYTVFLPVYRTLRIWRNRQKKMIEKVLFPSYIFINTLECYLYNICQVPKVSTFIRCGGKPAKISYNCIDTIKRMLSMDHEISVVNDFCEGEHVRILYGPLAGYEGVLVRQKSKTHFGIQLKEINHTVLINISTNFLEKVFEGKRKTENGDKR